MMIMNTINHGEQETSKLLVYQCCEYAHMTQNSTFDRCKEVHLAVRGARHCDWCIEKCLNWDRRAPMSCVACSEWQQFEIVVHAGMRCVLRIEIFLPMINWWWVSLSMLLLLKGQHCNVLKLLTNNGLLHCLRMEVKFNAITQSMTLEYFMKEWLLESNFNFLWHS